MSSSAATLIPRHIFGLKGNVKNNIWYIDENIIVFPCGHNTVIYNTETKDQQFISLGASDGITALAVTPNKRYVAVAEQSEKAAVNLYDLTTLRRRKMLSFPELGSTQFANLAFSADGKMCLTQGGAPDWMLVCWAWEKAKVIASGKVSNNAANPGAGAGTNAGGGVGASQSTVNVSTSVSSGAIYQADFCPSDSSVVCVTGDGILKFFRVSDNQFKPIPLSLKRDAQNYLCHTWLSDERVVVGTDSGDLLLIENFEFKQLLSSSSAQDKAVHSIVAHTKGFVCGCADGLLRIFERSDDGREYYKASKMFSIENNMSPITNMTISPSEDNLACTLANHQMYYLGLSNTDILKEEAMNFELLATSFHSPGESGECKITGLDTCIRKPLVVTCGMDRSVRVWNYMEKTTDLMKVFNEEALSVAFHPSGLHIAVGFTDKLRLMNLLMDDIRPVKEFPIKNCEECRFSNGGHHIAAVTQSSAIEIINTYSCEIKHKLRGQNTVKSLSWCKDDTKLVSAGWDGSIVLWDIKSETKDGTYMQPRCQFSCAVSNPDGSLLFSVSNDMTLKEFEPFSGAAGALNTAPSGAATSGGSTSNLGAGAAGGSAVGGVMSGNNWSVKNEVPTDVALGQLTLASSGRMLFASTVDPNKPGRVRSYKCPPASGNSSAIGGDELIEYPCHGGPITRMRLSHDNQFLFTTSVDGSLMIFETKEAKAPARGARERESAITFAEEILVTKSDLEEKTANMAELKSKVDELTLHNEYQLRLKDLNYKEKIKEVSEKFTAELGQDRLRYEDLRDEKRDMEMEYEEKLKQLEVKHTHELDELESTYKAKINAEVSRYQSLVQECDEMHQKWDEENQNLVEGHQQYLEELTRDYDSKVSEERETQARLASEKEEAVREFEDMKNLVEEDADLEIEEVKEKFDAKLSAEREATLRLKAENGIMKKKFSALNKDIEDQREEIRSLHEKEKELYENIKGLEKDIQGHKKEIREREETIQDKEKRIYDLKKKNQELEKFKFVLDYKIKELKRQIEPRENEIADMRQQIEEMDLELEQYHKSNAALDLMIGELRLKMNGMQQEINQQKGLLNDGDTLIQRFRTDLQETAQHLNSYKALKNSVTKLYKKYVQSHQSSSEPSGEADVQKEYNRQREYLEKSVESLKRKLAKDMEMHKNDNLRLMRENVSLTKEINELRREVNTISLVSKEEDQQDSGAFGNGLFSSSFGDANGFNESGVKSPSTSRSSAGKNARGGRQYVERRPPNPPSAKGGKAIQASVNPAKDGASDENAWREVEIQRNQIDQMSAQIAKLREHLGFDDNASSTAGTFRPASREKLVPLDSLPPAVSR